MLEQISHGGVGIKTITCTLWNRTGGTLSPGRIVAFNLDFAATSGQAMTGLNPSDSTDGAAGYVLGSGIMVTTANMRKALAVVADTPDGSQVQDNAPFTAILQGYGVNAYLEGSSGVGAGEWLKGTNNTSLTSGDYVSYLTGQTDAELGSTAAADATDIVKVVGIALEAGGSASASARKKILFWGGNPVLGLICKGGAT